MGCLFPIYCHPVPAWGGVAGPHCDFDMVGRRLGSLSPRCVKQLKMPECALSVAHSQNVGRLPLLECYSERLTLSAPDCPALNLSDLTESLIGVQSVEIPEPGRPNPARTRWLARGRLRTDSKPEPEAPATATPAIIPSHCDRRKRGITRGASAAGSRAVRSGAALSGGCPCGPHVGSSFRPGHELPHAAAPTSTKKAVDRRPLRGCPLRSRTRRGRGRTPTGTWRAGARPFQLATEVPPLGKVQVGGTITAIQRCLR
jgi:hypothetical protein